ncbi:DUF4245 domain-containing protein [Actinoplanes sp. NPDC023714]|uniref:DUF4245 domain-containing protein n=1 Tax=Actinoplanes sp. NPDC023714 TaxID=3154322 RepID=UPI0033E5ABF7
MEPATSAPAPAPARLAPKEGRRPRDMIYSLLVLLVPIALVMVFWKVVLDGDKPLTKDPSSAIQSASREFTVAQPAGLSEDWHVTSATFGREEGGATLRIGYVDPDADPILVVQSTVPADTLVPAEVGDQGKRTGTFRTANRTWMTYSGRPGETAFIVTEQNRTIVLIGETKQKNMETLAAALS